MDVVVVAEQVLFLYTGESWVILRKGDGVNGGNDTVESDFTRACVIETATANCTRRNKLQN